MISIKTRYAVNFDLSIELLKEHYSATHPKGAYAEILRYMESHGFIHRQYSGYISEESMERQELLEFVSGLYRDLPWIKDCVKKIDATMIGEIFDLTKYIDNTYSYESYERKKEEISHEQKEEHRVTADRNPSYRPGRRR